MAAPAPSQVRSGAAPGEAPSGIVEETDFAAEPASFDIVSLYGVTGGVPGGVAGGLGEATEVVVSAPPAPPREPVRVGGRVVTPSVVHRVDPRYPRIAQDTVSKGSPSSKRSCPAPDASRTFACCGRIRCFETLPSALSSSGVTNRCS